MLSLIGPDHQHFSFVFFQNDTARRGCKKVIVDKEISSLSKHYAAPSPVRLLAAGVNLF